MKKFILFIMLLFEIVYASEIDLAKNAKSAILVESTTGKIIFEKNKDEKRSPASMTKIMTLLLTMESIDSGNLSFSDKVNVSKNASGMGGTQIFIEEGSSVDVLTLVKGISIASANDAAVAIAEKIGGTEEVFVNMMNDKARELGCKNTNFMNPHGLDEEGHYTTAYDLSLIARELLKHEDILEFTSTYEDYIDVGGENHLLVNTNKLVRFYEGIDGLKTGYTDKAKYCLTATMKRNDMRLLSIVMGEDTKDNRNNDTISMMEYGYSQYGISKIHNNGDKLGSIVIDNAKNKNVDYYIGSDVSIITTKESKNIDYKTDIKLFDLKAPLKKNSIIGKYELSYNSDKYVYDIVIHEDVIKSSIFDVFFMVIKNIFSGSE